MQRYLAAYRRYLQLLTEDIGILLPADSYATFLDDNGKPVFYSIQEKISVPAMCHKAIHWLTEADALILFARVLQELQRVWDFNAGQTSLMGRFLIGLLPGQTMIIYMSIIKRH